MVWTHWPDVFLYVSVLNTNLPALGTLERALWWFCPNRVSVSLESEYWKVFGNAGLYIIYTADFRWPRLWFVWLRDSPSYLIGICDSRDRQVWGERWSNSTKKWNWKIDGRRVSTGQKDSSHPVSILLLGILWCSLSRSELSTLPTTKNRTVHLGHLLMPNKPGLRKLHLERRV